MHNVVENARVRRLLEAEELDSGGPKGAKTFDGIALRRTVLEIMAVKVGLSK